MIYFKLPLVSWTGTTYQLLIQAYTKYIKIQTSLETLNLWVPYTTFLKNQTSEVYFIIIDNMKSCKIYRKFPLLDRDEMSQISHKQY